MSKISYIIWLSIFTSVFLADSVHGQDADLLVDPDPLSAFEESTTTPDPDVQLISCTDAGETTVAAASSRSGLNLDVEWLYPRR